MVARVCALLCCVACSDRVERVLANDGDPVEGERLWNVHCEECHAADGTGTETGPDITDDPEADAVLADKILYGWGSMEGFADELSNQEVADVVAFVEEHVFLE